MGIRTASDKDVVKIGDLLAQLGYPTEQVFLQEKILQLLGDSSHVLVVYEERGNVESVMSERNCDRIQVHCNIRRTDAHRFYERQGYTESRKYFSKKLEKHFSSIEIEPHLLTNQKIEQ